MSTASRHIRVPMPALGLALGTTSLGLAVYFFARSRVLAPTSEFGGVFEAGVADLFGLFAAGAVLLATLALTVRRRWPSLSQGAGLIVVVCGVVPPALAVAFIVLQQFG